MTDEEKISRTPYFAWWKFPKMLILPFDVLTSAVTSFALLGCPSLRASSPIWASETSLARTRERAAKPRGENLIADFAVRYRNLSKEGLSCSLFLAYCSRFFFISVICSLFTNRLAPSSEASQAEDMFLCKNEC